MAPPTATRGAAARPLLALAVLVAVLAFAFDSMHGQLQRNGYYGLIQPLIRGDVGAGSTLPGTSRPILRRYTGVAALDQIYVGANVFFANILDGSLPECTLFALQFGGQLPAVITIVVVESLRVAPPTALVRSAAIWGLAMQGVGFGVIMPLWCILYFALPRPNPASPDAAKLRDPIKLHSVIPAFVLGYVFPCALVSYPYEDAAWRQRANVFWQYFPIWVSLLLNIFTGVSKRTSIGQNFNRSSAQVSRDALNHAYTFAYGFAALIQWVTYSVMIAAYLFPEEFPAGVAQRLTPGALLVPGSPHSFTPMGTPAATIFDFLRYDEYNGAVALAIWALTVARESGVNAVTTVEFIRDSVLVGPCAAAMKVLWRRDEALLSKA